MFDLLFPVLAIGGMGVLFGGLLAFASKIFEVKKDERIPKISELLPGANCGGCGYAGCVSYAEAIVTTGATINCCPSCNQEILDKIAEITGADSSKAEPKCAYVLCSGNFDVATEKYIYEGNADCHSAMKLAGGSKGCKHGCLGLGSCVKRCKFNAISIISGVATVDREKCVGCGVCALECPKNIIKILPKDTKFQVMCSSLDKGKQTRQVCSVGCIGCGICAKNCPSEAIEMKDNLAFIDSSKCSGCGVCVEKCPQKIIYSFED